LDIGRGKAEAPSPRVASLDIAFDGIGTAEKEIGGSDPSLLEKVADQAGTDHEPGSFNRLDGFDVKAELPAKPPERANIAQAVFAEAKTGADNDRPGSERFDEDLLDEIFSSESGELTVEGNDKDHVRVELLDLLEALLERLDHPDFFRAEDLFGMRGKGQNAGEEGFFSGLIGQKSQDFLMPKVEAVEVADSQRRFSREGGDRVERAEDFHELKS
jgi:hypothetical protein